MALTLACGPYFEPSGLIATIVVLCAVKPLTYFAFIQAFRYRVNRAAPMSVRRAAVLATIRSLAGLALLGLAYVALAAGLERADGGPIVAWVALSAERLVIWLLLGWKGASLRGRRLVGWTISGVLLDIAYDAAIGMGLLAGWWVHLIAIGAVAAFIVPLTLIGRRDSLRARFNDGHLCRGCRYDLTGNLSGICPECGRPIGDDEAAA